MLVKDVYVFDGNPLTAKNDLRIEGGIIRQIEPELVPVPGEKVIAGNGQIAFPGIIDAHQHVWQGAFKGFASNMMLLQYLDEILEGIGSGITAEDLYTLNLYGYLDAAAAGITTVFDWCHVVNSPEHADAALQAAMDAGIQVLFFHGPTAIGKNKWWNNSTLAHSHDLERVVNKYRDVSPLVKIGMAMRGPEFAAMEINRQDIAFATALNIPVSMHAGCSVLGKIHQPVSQLAKAGLLSPQMNLVHCNTLSDEEFSLIEEAGCLVSITPEAEMQTGLGTPASAWIQKNKNLRWSIGTDIPTGSTSSMLFQVRLLLQHYRSVVNQQFINRMEFPVAMPFKANPFFFQAQQNALDYTGFNATPSLTVGAAASFVLADWQDLRHSAYAGTPAFYYLNEANFTRVISNGQLIKDGQHWPGHNMTGLRNKVEAIVKRLTR